MIAEAEKTFFLFLQTNTMSGNTSATTQLKTITIKRIFNLPLQKVWKGWSEPESFKKWYSPQEYTCPGCNIEFK